MGFENDLVVKLVDDTANNGQGAWELMIDLKFTTNAGERYTVPAGFVTDFASVPRAPIAYMVTGNRAHRAATLHDYLCRHEVIPRLAADDVFYEAMLSTGIDGAIASMMHIAVRSYTQSLQPKGPEGEGHNFI